MLTVGKQGKFYFTIMEYTSIERISIANILIHMMNADNDIDIREVLYFNQIQNTIGITNDEYQKGKEQNLLISLLCVQSMSNQKKLALGLMLTEMINADGKVDNKELEVFSIVCKATGLDNIINNL